MLGFRSHMCHNAAEACFHPAAPLAQMVCDMLVARLGTSSSVHVLAGRAGRARLTARVPWRLVAVLHGDHFVADVNQENGL